MIISMQGNWTVTVTVKSAAFPQRFIITGATTGNGIHPGIPGTSVNVTGDQWSIGIQHDPGNGYRSSDLRVKSPVMSAGDYVFNIESNDSGRDQDFNDLILTCRTPVGIDDYLVYGHVLSYWGCPYNPCFKRAVVIDTPVSLQKALQNPALRKAIEQLYPERVKPPVIVNPNPPDPPFIPMVINVLDEEQMPAKTFSLYHKTAPGGTKDTPDAEVPLLSDYTFDRTVTDKTAVSVTEKYNYNRLSVAAVIDRPVLFCHVDNLAYQTLHFLEYDRTAAELAGGPYTGAGVKTGLGYATTDIIGNFIFRFKQTLPELINEILHDVAPGEDPFLQAHPDIIVRIEDPITGATLFETAPYYNIPPLKKINLCIPSSVLRPTKVCEVGNLFSGIGTVPIPGNPNTSFLPAARANAFTTLGADGKLTNHDGNPTAPQIDNGCWNGYIDLKGCMDNPDAFYYTIRYRRSGGSWQFVNENFHLARLSDPDLTSPNTKVGPFSGISLHVPGFGTADVPYYKNIQREFTYLHIDWRPESIWDLIQLNSLIYQDTPRGPIDFRIDVYKQNGDQITSDLITLFIDNDAVVYEVADAWFETTVSSDCVLFALTDTEISQPMPLKAFFRANEPNGFLQSYTLTLGKGKHNTAFPIDPASTDEPKTHHIYNTSTDGPLFSGTFDVFGGDPGVVEVDLVPASGKWLLDDQSFCTFTVNLYVQKRGTNGYVFDGGEGPKQFIFGLQRLNP